MGFTGKLGVPEAKLGNFKLGITTEAAEFAADDRGRHHVRTAAEAEDRGRHHVRRAAAADDRGRHKVRRASEAEDAGGHKSAQTASERFELYRGIDTDPDFDATPFDTNPTLPFTSPTVGIPGAGTEDHHLVLRPRNRYGVLQPALWERVVTVESGGAEVVQPPSAPVESTIAAAAGGQVRVQSRYNYRDDQTPADQWALYLRDDGSDPDPTSDTPTLVDQADPRVDTQEVLDELIGGSADGATVKVIVRARRESDGAESTNLDVLTVTADALGPPAVSPRQTMIGTTAKQAGTP